MMDGKGGQGLESSKSQFTVSKPDRRYSYRDMNYLIGKVWKTSTPYGYRSFVMATQLMHRAISVLTSRHERHHHEVYYFCWHAVDIKPSVDELP
jgi:hypothetical protein